MIRSVFDQKFPIVRDGSKRGMINIYRGKDGYYYGSAPREHRDRMIEKSISADYAFNYVSKRNKPN